MQISTGPIGAIDKHKPVHIFGAGISGLLMGYYLKKNHYQIKIFEKEKRPGGKIETLLTPHGPIEFAANAIYANEEVLELLDELGINYITATQKLKKKIFRTGKVVSRPLMILEMVKTVFKLFKKPPRITLTTTLYDFFEPLLGEKLCREVLDAALSGVYAASSDDLNFLSLFKETKSPHTYLEFFIKLRKNKNSKKKPQSVSFENGMNDFIQKLEEKLKEDIEYNSVKELDALANNIICTEAFSAAKLLKKDFSPLAELLEKIDYIPLQTSTFILDTKLDILNESFGIVFSKSSHQFLKGILHNSEIFKDRETKYEVASYTFITTPLQDAKLDIEKELKNLFDVDITSNITLFQTKLWNKAIPFYSNKRAELIGRLRSEIFSYPQGLVLFGNYIDGISIREMIHHAKHFSKKYNLS